MVAVLNMKFYKFSDTNNDKGINNGSMVAIEKHSARRYKYQTVWNQEQTENKHW